MKNIYGIFLIMVSYTLFSQNIIILDSNYNNISNIYEARDAVIYKPGYRYKPQTNNEKMIGRINDAIIGDVNYSDANSITNVDDPINTNLTVGSISGNYDVTNIGSAIYSIPIFTPKGINNMQPNVSIVYNSSSKYGIAGAGWNISGLSVISRSNKDYYHDGKVEEMHIGASGKYNLDGNRLIYNSNYTYFLENENFSEVKYKTTDNYFIVKNTNGTIYEYGNTLDSKFKLNNNPNKTINWYINKVTDVFGNSIIYKYLNDGDYAEVVLESIEYANNKIEFLYQDRTVDNSIGYIQGYATERKKLLRKIKVYSNNTKLREYEFKYKNDNDLITQLYEITEKGLNEEQINSVIYKYEEQRYSNEQNLETIGILNYTDIEDADYTTGDFNGDGINDLVAYTYDNSSGAKIYDKLKLYLSDNLSYNLTSTIDIPNGFFPFHSIQDETRFLGYPNDIYKIDINADGNDDLILKFAYNSSFNYIPYYSNGSGFDVGNTCLSISTSQAHSVAFGDFNGDSKLDIFALIYKSGNDAYIINNIENENNSSDYLDYKELDFDVVDPTDINKSINPINFNNDSKTEILTRSSHKGCVIEFKNIPNSIIPIKSSIIKMESLFCGNNDNWKIGDINGDGISDLIPVSETVMGVLFGNGAGYNSSIYIPTNACNKYNTVIFDFNNDGKDDIIRYGENKICIYYSQSDTIFINKNYTYSISNTDYFIGFGTYGILGFSGISDYYRLIFQRNNEPKTHELFVAGKLPHLLSKVRDSFGNITEFQYSNLTNTNIYTKGTGATFPVIDFIGALPIVSSVITSNGIGGTITTNYKYEGAKIHLQGRGFLGFSKIIAESEDANIKKIKHFAFDNYYFVNNYFKEETKTFNDNIISSTENIFELNHNLDIDAGIDPNIDSYKRFKLKLISSNSNNYLKGTISETTNEYYTDIYSNIKKSTTNINNEYKTENTFEYNDNFFFVDNVPVLIKKQTTKNIKLSDNTSFTKTVDYTYNNGILDTKKIDNVTTNYTFDSFGNLTNTTITADDPLLQPRTTSAIYDNTGRFLTSKTNVLGHTTLYEYNNSWGNVSKITDINNKETLFEYDNWGQLKKTIYPTGVIAENSINWLTEQDANMPTALYYTTSTATNNPYSKTYFDSFGRELRGETEIYENKIFADTRYDDLGRLSEQYDTYFSGDFSSANKTVNYYEPNFGRIKKVEYQNSIQNLTTNFNYIAGTTSNPYKEITEIPTLGRTYTSNFDALGNVIKSQYPLGEVTTTFGSNGQAKSITAFNANTTMQYDPITAQQTGLTDPNSGTNLYEYNQFGELTKQTDGKGSVQNVFLDNYGRTNYTTNTEGLTNYEYVETGNGIEQIKETEAPNGYKTTYIYDEFGRIKQSTEIIDNQNYIKSFEYYPDGRLKTETYPSGYAIEYLYNNNGELTSIKQLNNNQTIWYCNNYNENGQPNEIYLGNNSSNLKTLYTYNEFNKLTNIKTGNSFEMQYNWDNITGNLTSRTDVLKNLQEEFTYDNLDRLETWQINNGDTFTTSYANNGNITSKTDVGNYIYNPAKVHAIETINYPTETISINQQDITYTSFNKAKTITEGNYNLQIEYGAENYRKKTTLQENSTTINTRIFAGNYEKEILEDGTVKEYHYISGPTGLIAIYIKENGTEHLYYTATDHLGSICQIIEPNGTVVEETNYDPWGRIRTADTWEYDNTAKLTKTYRGYTGHEMLPEFGLINMNGRIYDPALARMLSPDNYVQSPYNPQNYNRYAYVLNNPLKYTDPSGEFWHLVIGAVIGGSFNVLMNWGNIDNFGEGLKYFGIGAVAGALGAGIGAGVGVAVQGGSFGAGFIGTTTAVAGGGFLGGASAGFTNGFITGTGNSLMQGETFENSLTSGLKSGTVQGLIGGSIAGTIALISGRSFWTGDVTFNDKFNAFISANENALRKEYGDELFENTDIQTKRRLFLKGKLGEKPFAQTYKTNIESGQYFEDSQGYKSKIYFSRKTVRLSFRNDIRATGHLFHEFNHASENYSGWDNFLREALGNDKANILMEYNTYEKIYNMFGTQYDGYIYFNTLYQNTFFP